MALIKKVYGVKTPVSPRIFAVHGVSDHHPKKPKTCCGAIRNWQPHLTSAEAVICQR